MKLFVILLFAATYVAMIALPKWRYIVALASAAIMIVSGALPAAEAFGQIDWNVLMMLERWARSRCSSRRECRSAWPTCC